MRFKDTPSEWQAQIDKIESDRNLMTFVKSISPEKIQLVETKSTLPNSKLSSAMCHENVKNHVNAYGGQHIYGWVLRPWEMYDTKEFDGMFLAVFHSNWLSNDGELISVTPDDTKYHIFIEDKRRKFDFQKLESFNNRVVYLNSYSPPLNAYNPSRNVNYFFAQKYADRDKTFEKYKIISSPDQMFELVPEIMKKYINGKPQLTPEGIRYIGLKTSATIRR